MLSAARIAVYFLVLLLSGVTHCPESWAKEPSAHDCPMQTDCLEWGERLCPGSWDAGLTSPSPIKLRPASSFWTVPPNPEVPVPAVLEHPPENRATPPRYLTFQAFLI